MEKKNRKSNSLGRLILILGMLCVMAAAGWFVLFRVNRFSLSLQLKGDSEQLVDYGRDYADPGAVAILRGTLFLREGISLEQVAVHREGVVRMDALGQNILGYSAEFMGFRASAERRVRVVDREGPVITLKDDPDDLPDNIPYQEAGFVAVDNCDGDITHKVIRKEHMGMVTYSVLDSSGNLGYAEREIPWYDNQPPQIFLKDGDSLSISVGAVFSDPGFTAVDNGDGDISDRVVAEGAVDCFRAGSYTLTYWAEDSSGNRAEVQRTVEVTAQPRPQTVYPEGKVIYLTFDDGPGPYTEHLLDVLDKYGVKATFFVVDTGYYDTMRRIVDRGHSIGIHTMTHTYEEIYSGPEAYFQDLTGMQQLIYDQTGMLTTLMRFPGGSSNTVSCKLYEGLMTLLTEAVQDAGFQYFDWNVDSMDAGGATKAAMVTENVTQGVLANRCSVVLQHDIHPYSVEAVEKIIQWGLANGYTFLPLREDSPGMHHGLHN